MPEPPPPCPTCGQRPFDHLVRATRRERMLVTEGAVRLTATADLVGVLRWLEQTLDRPPLRGVPVGTEPVVLLLAALSSDIRERIYPLEEDAPNVAALADVSLDAPAADEEERVAALRAALGGPFA